ncbi:MAG TPA: PBP1A family penicillin-binding protein [Candidatus Polarisedimenticolaceae bacterium]|nr:PBP1A family penicillin-binding protein [Candidatus Polarisedimenticolaceae bacterium]
MNAPRRGTSAPRRTSIAKWLRAGRYRWLLGIGVPLLVVGLIVVLAVFTQITLTFEGRLWRLPSRVYSARLHLVPGTVLDRDALAMRLDRCGYARLDSSPLQPGQYRKRSDAIDLYVRGFRAEDRTEPARRATLRFSGSVLTGISDERGRPAAALDIEPELLALVFGAQQEERLIVPLGDAPKTLVNAVLAAEDARFYHHAGIDPFAVIRAAFTNVKSGKIVQGGSTITQQTVKNLYFGQERTWWRKAREALMSVILDVRYPKDRILEVYLNEVYLGQRGSVAICGMQAAARYYFGRNVADLSLAESATLAGLIRNPGGYNPFAHPERAVARRNLVLDAMLELGLADKQAVARAKADPLRLASGGAGYSRAPYVVDLVRAQLAESYPARALSEDGLEIYTTIDTLVQARAEQALERGLDRLEKETPQVRRQKARRRLQGCVVVTDPRTGAILALVGGRDYQDSQFNRATQAKRQPGSCFKPFVYLAAFEAAMRGEEGGLMPASILDDSPFELVSGGRVWSPANYDGTYRGPTSARVALEESRNVPTARAAQAVGLGKVVDAARQCGFVERFEPLPSLALGAQEVTPLELATAYGTLATLGLRVQPRIVQEVVARDGKRLTSESPVVRDAVPPAAAYLVDDVLRGVLVRGTAASAGALGFHGDAAGKTGTTDDTRDAWFVGFTPKIVALVWVGYDDNSKTGLTGAAGALPIWVDIFMHARHRWEGSEFPEPPGIERAEVDPESGGLAVAGCPDRVEEVFAAGTEPEECPIHENAFRRWWQKLFHRDREPARPPI